MADRPRSVGLVVVVLALSVGGCGSGGGGQAHAAKTTPRPAATTPHGGRSGPRIITIPDPGPTGRPADPAAVKVIEGWSSALRHGDVRAAAGFFALPSTLINGIDGNGQPLVLNIRTSDQALAANTTLPCGARFISADQRGRYVNALFRLTGRPGPGGSSCGGGQTARTNFLIARGHIVDWIRAPDDPRDNGGQTAPQPAPTPLPPQSQPGGTPVV
jgi:hypothetical protein